MRRKADILAGALALLVVATASAGNAAAAVGRSDAECLALNVYHEARGEPLDGMIGVALVVMHRVADKQHPNTVCGVISDGASRRGRACQFSWVCDGHPNTPHDKHRWLVSQAIAGAVLRNEVPDVVRGARFFVRCEIRRPWMAHLRFVTRIGDHCWYGDPGDVDGDEPLAVGFAVVSSVAKPTRPEDLRLVTVPIEPDYAPPAMLSAAAAGGGELVASAGSADLSDVDDAGNQEDDAVGNGSTGLRLALLAALLGQGRAPLVIR